MDNSRYEFQHDRKYCYENSNVLINTLGITEQKELDIAEKEITSLAIAEAEIRYIKGNFDTKHFKNIHKRIFGNIYFWAGEIRTVDISKGAWFCLCIYIDNELNRIFNELTNEKFLIFTDVINIPERFSYYLGELNSIHPFREGNGRVQRLFIEYLGLIAGYEVDFSNISRAEMINASIDSFATNYTVMTKMFKKVITPLPMEMRREIALEICSDKKIINYTDKFLKI